MIGRYSSIFIADVEQVVAQKEITWFLGLFTFRDHTFDVFLQITKM